jgi:hypothetical protein
MLRSLLMLLSLLMPLLLVMGEMAGASDWFFLRIWMRARMRSWQRI